jgi:Txe/YoeB family toxin of Txe-Axe toxin-antitoxin module
MLHFRANHFGANHFAALHLRGPAASGGDTHDGGSYIPEHLLKWWKKQHEKKKPTIEEVIEAVQENPVEALKAVPQAKKQFQGIDYSKVKQNAEMALFIAQELMIVLEMRRIDDENDENDAIMLLLM